MTNRYPDLIGPKPPKPEAPEYPTPWTVGHAPGGATVAVIKDAGGHRVPLTDQSVAAMIVELVNAEAGGVTENVTSATEGDSDVVPRDELEAWCVRCGQVRHVDTRGICSFCGRKPLAVGDVLTADSPEPPVGTVVSDKDGERWTRRSATGWVTDWSSNPTWANVRRYAPLTVVKVGDGDD